MPRKISSFGNALAARMFSLCGCEIGGITSRSDALFVAFVPLLFSERFCTALKNRHIIFQTSNDQISSIRGVRRPLWLPLRVFEQLARFARSIARFVIVSSNFIGSTKIKTSPKTLRMFVGQCGGPYGVIENIVWTLTW